jgi:UDP-N-acetylmuramoyl-L-alanyl-D-glutamate--2,6-diaminopimelate ligase
MNDPQTLKTLLQDVFDLPKALDTHIHGITLDSRSAKSGDLFIAVSGLKHKADDFIDEAIRRGTAAVLLEQENESAGVVLCERGGAVLLSLPGLKSVLGKIAARFFGEPSCQLSVIGITGTNGKTSVSHYLSQVLNYLGCKCGVIGTLGYGFEGGLRPSTHTTPDVISAHRWLSEMHKEGAQSVAMEVSSHGLDQGRVDQISFTGAIFTNLSRDHLDYHGSMEQYGNVKKKLFTQYSPGFVVINIDDGFGASLANQLDQGQKIIRYGMSDKADLEVTRVEYGRFGVRAEIKSPWGNRTLNTKLMGSFNLSNLLAVIGGGIGMGYSLDSLIDAMKEITPVPGRMQPVTCSGQATVVIDYAHTPDALENALKSARLHCDGVLWCVFGCGGDRDKGKRPLMGEIAEKWSDKVVVTNDNTRSENPEKIIEDILAGMRSTRDVIRQQDRALAIEVALNHSKAGDLVLIAGKGHERYQEVNGERFEFSDYDTVMNVFSKKANQNELKVERGHSA